MDDRQETKRGRDREGMERMERVAGEGRWREMEVAMDVDDGLMVLTAEETKTDRGQRSAVGYMRGCILGSARSKGTFLKPRLRRHSRRLMDHPFDGNGSCPADAYAGDAAAGRLMSSLDQDRTSSRQSCS
jgi:hypothetical protein